MIGWQALTMVILMTSVIFSFENLAQQTANQMRTDENPVQQTANQMRTGENLVQQTANQMRRLPLC